MPSFAVPVRFKRGGTGEKPSPAACPKKRRKGAADRSKSGARVLRAILPGRDAKNGRTAGVTRHLFGKRRQKVVFCPAGFLCKGKTLRFGQARLVFPLSCRPRRKNRTCFLQMRTSPAFWERSKGGEKPVFAAFFPQGDRQPPFPSAKSRHFLRPKDRVAVFWACCPLLAKLQAEPSGVRSACKGAKNPAKSGVKPCWKPCYVLTQETICTERYGPAPPVGKKNITGPS